MLGAALADDRVSAAHAAVGRRDVLGAHEAADGAQAQHRRAGGGAVGRGGGGGNGAPLEPPRPRERDREDAELGRAARPRGLEGRDWEDARRRACCEG